MVAFTTNKHYAVQTVGEHPGTWGASGTTGEDLNTGVMGLMDTQMAGAVTFSVSATNVTLSYANVQNCYFRFQGTLLANIVVEPDVGDATTYFNGFYMFENVTTGNFSITIQNASGSMTVPPGRRGLFYISIAAGFAPRMIAVVGTAGTGDPVPAGSRTLWYNTAAPVGWTAVAFNNYAIKIVTSGLGGVTSGSVGYSTLFGRTATDGYTLTLSDIPSHTHTLPKSANGTTFTGATALLTNPNGSDVLLNNVTGASGGGASHSHGIDMRVQTAAFTLCTRD